MFAEVADKPSDRQSEIRPAGCTWPVAMLQAGNESWGLPSVA